MKLSCTKCNKKIIRLFNYGNDTIPLCVECSAYGTGKNRPGSHTFTGPPNKRTILLYTKDHWNNQMKYIWSLFLDTDSIYVEFIEVTTALEFIGALNTATFDGIIIMFNPYIEDFDEAWQELIKNSFYKNNPVLYVMNTYGVSFCQKYKHKEIDRGINFCNSMSLFLRVVAYYIEKGTFTTDMMKFDVKECKHHTLR